MDDSLELGPLLLEWAAKQPVSPVSQRTLERPSPWLRGREPQSGHPVAVRMFPAPPGAGIVYTTDRSYARRSQVPHDGAPPQPNARQSFRADLAGARSIDVCIGVGHRGSPGRRPALWITHIEHLNAALLALGVDNVIILVSKDTIARDWSDKRALPILESCTLGFVRGLVAAGLAEQTGHGRRYRTLVGAFDDVDPERGDRIRATALGDPCAPIEVCYHSGYEALGVEDRDLTVTITPAEFLRDVGAARTMLGQLNSLPLTLGRFLGLFAFASYGFGLGVNPENTMAPVRGSLVGEPRYGSPGQELVRHKIIDFLGAVALMGPLSGIRFDVTKSGHANDLRALRRLERKLVPLVRRAE